MDGNTMTPTTKEKGNVNIQQEALQHDLLVYIKPKWAEGSFTQCGTDLAQRLCKWR